MTMLQIIFWILLLDSLIAGYIAWCGNREKWNNMKFFQHYMPLTKGWTAWYIILVLFIGYLIY
jgi:heme/copper-type cytochrome/quinol oxidase subunit 2